LDEFRFSPLPPLPEEKKVIFYILSTAGVPKALGRYKKDRRRKRQIIQTHLCWQRCLNQIAGYE